MQLLSACTDHEGKGLLEGSSASRRCINDRVVFLFRYRLCEYQCVKRGIACASCSTGLVGLFLTVLYAFFRVSLKAAEGPYVSQFQLSISSVLRRLPVTEGEHPLVCTDSCYACMTVE